MAIIDPWHFEVDGVPFATFAHGLETVDGTENIPPRRIRERSAAYIDGSFPRRAIVSFHTHKEQRLRVWISPFDVDGNVTYANGPRAHLRENLETMFRLLGGKGGSNHLVKWYVPTADDTKPLHNWARFSLPQIVTGQSRLVRRVDITAIYQWPYFRDHLTGLVTLGPFTGAQSFTPGGTAPLSDIVFKAISPGRITHDETDDWIEVATNPVGDGSTTIDQRPPRSILSSDGSDARYLYSAAKPWGLRFSAGEEANLTITGSWQIDYYNSEH